MTAVAKLGGQGAPADIPASVLQVAEGLHAVAGAIPADASVSWIPKGLSGWLPSQCYVFQSGGETLILDGGLGMHRQEIAAGLDHLLLDRANLRLLVSRWEPDAMGNLPWLVQRYRISSVMSLGGINPLDFFDGFDAAAVESHVEMQAAPAKLLPIMPGDRIRVGDFEIEVINPSLRLLLTTWFYESRTRSLFSADSWGFLSNPAAPLPFKAGPVCETITASVLRAALATKFDWLLGAHCEDLVRDLKVMLVSRQIDRICPTFGGVIEGPDQARAVIEATMLALEQLSQMPRQRALAGFDWEKALDPTAIVPADLLKSAAIPR